MGVELRGHLHAKQRGFRSSYRAQLKVIIWTNFDVPKAKMLHTKAQGHWPFGSEDFRRVFTIYGHGGHLDHVSQIAQTNFRFPDPWRCHMKFGFDWPSGFGVDLWKWRRSDRRRSMALYYKLTNEPKGSGELKTGNKTNARQHGHLIFFFPFIWTCGNEAMYRWLISYIYICTTVNHAYDHNHKHKMSHVMRKNV